MIITRTPYRLSFFGGGTDFPGWYLKNGGRVISSTINKFSYINLRYLPSYFKYKSVIRYYQREEVNNFNDIKHPSVKECLKFCGIKKGVEIVHAGDLPAQSGLGTSSCFTVGLLNALYALKGQIITKKQLANESIFVEQKKIRENVGSQDQTASAFGGINKIEFGTKENVVVSPLVLKENSVVELENNLLLFFTGLSRNSSEIAKLQIKNLHNNSNYLYRMMELVDESEKQMCMPKFPSKEFGKLLHEQWQIKKKLSNKISNKKIDDLYDQAINHGAIGGKLLGAGNGGFILFYVEKNKRKKFLKKFNKLLHVPFRFDFTGSQIIHYSYNN